MFEPPPELDMNFENEMRNAICRAVMIPLRYWYDDITGICDSVLGLWWHSNIDKLANPQFPPTPELAKSVFRKMFVIEEEMQRRIDEGRYEWLI